MSDLEELLEESDSEYCEYFKSLSCRDRAQMEDLHEFSLLAGALFLPDLSRETATEIEGVLMRLAVSLVNDMDLDEIGAFGKAWAAALEDAKDANIRSRMGLRRGYDFFVVASLSRY